MRGKVQLVIFAGVVYGITPAYAGKSIERRIISKQTKDHPRLCGEKHIEVYAICDITGSPPPMRGKGIDLYPAVPQKRITPAYAGKRPAGSSMASVPKDHPRLCGEKKSNDRTVCANPGSPPPMRGKVARAGKPPVFGRITPAYAGKRLGAFFQAQVYEGSPPPMRGKAHKSSGTAFLIRITPAYAGKSLAEFGKTSKAWDHPRLCGEKKH